MWLTTERLILRDFVESDWPAMLEYQREESFLRYHPWESRGEADVRSLLERFIQWQEEEPRHRFQPAITRRGSDEVIGSVGVRANDPGGLIADLGFELAPRCWGKGFATEAASAMLEFGFQQMELHRITAHCIAENTASARVLERIGMRPEGRLREAEYFRGRWWDVLLYAVLSSDPRPADISRSWTDGGT